jgi:tRNA wybutosine-synthesizing protein 1
VTQLYVSVDASTKESLKKIDRPLFKDFWERFVAVFKLKVKVHMNILWEITPHYLYFNKIWFS